jgi:hypothetical protein
LEYLKKNKKYSSYLHGLSLPLLKYPNRAMRNLFGLSLACTVETLFYLGFALFNRNPNDINGFAGSLLGRLCTVAIHLGLLTVLNGFFDVCYAEIGLDMSGYTAMVSNTANRAISKPDNLAKLPPAQSPQKNQDFLGEEDEELVYLAVYLNNRMLTEVLEAKEKSGAVYFKLNEIAQLVESAPPKDANTIATLEALEKNYPAKFNYSQRLQALIIEGNGELPVEKRWQRERRQKTLSNNTITEDTPIVDFEYGLLGRPSFDLSARYLKNGHESFNYSFKAGMEALYGTASIFGLGANDDELTDLRVSWERLNKDWFVQLGDVFAPPIELVARAEAGQGINFTTVPIENASQFDTDTITGDLMEGWEVELYRGNTLLDFRRSDGSGRYIFRDIPLLFGENNITLKFYGPQGQFRQESRAVNIGQNMTPEGKLWTRLSFIDQGENIFLGRNSQTRGQIEGFRGFGEVFYGLSKRLTLTGSITSFKSNSTERKVLGKAGFQMSYFGSSLKADFLADDNDGYGLQYSFLSRILGWGAQYSHVEFFDLKTDLEPNLKRRRTLRLNRGFDGFFLELNAEQRVDTFDVTRHKYGGKVSGGIGLVSLTTDMEANFGGGTEFTRGNLLVNGRIGPKLLLRTGLNYEVHPETEVRNVRGTLDYRVSNDMTLRLDVIKNMISQQDYVISQSLLWNGKKVGLGLTGTYSTEQDFQVTASVTFSLSPDLSGGYQVNRNSSTNIGTVNVRVFLDHNQDGIYNSAIDELLENVRLQHQSDESGKNGMIAFKGSAYRLARLKIDENTLPDLFMISPDPVAVRPRPTHINTMNIPVWETGEIEGQAEPGELVELIEDGKVIASTHAEFDGFFLFGKVRFKIYGVRTRRQLQKVEVNRNHPIARVRWNGEYELAKK